MEYNGVLDKDPGYGVLVYEWDFKS
jgi:hypothetical protein